MVREGALDLLIDQASIERDRRGRSFPGRADDLGAGIGGVARDPDAGNGCAPRGIMDRPAVFIHLTAQAGEQLSVGYEARANEHRRARDDGAAAQFDALQPVVVDDQPRDCALDDVDATGGQALALLRAEGVAVWEQGDVGRPLPNQQRVLDRLGRAPSTPSGWSRTS